MASRAREMVKIVMSWRRFTLSIARVRAAMMPAAGTLMLLLRLPRRLNRRKINLYAVLKHIRNKPNRIQSRRELNLRRLRNCLEGLAISTMLFRINKMEKPMRKFFSARRIKFSKQLSSCLQTSFFVMSTDGNKCSILRKIDFFVAIWYNGFLEESVFISRLK